MEVCSLKRDIELIIRLLAVIEERPAEDSGLELYLDDVDDEHVQYNLGLMKEAGLIKAIDATSSDGIQYLPIRLTWTGHDFLDSARSETVLSKAKEVASKQGLELMKLPIDIVKNVLTKVTLELLV